MPLTHPGTSHHCGVLSVACPYARRISHEPFAEVNLLVTAVWICIQPQY